MNAFSQNPAYVTTATDQLCSVHNKPCQIILGRAICEDCAAENIAKAQAEHNQQLQDSMRAKHFAGAFLPSRYAECGFKNYLVANEGQKAAKAQCAKFASGFIHGQTANMIMVGRTGTGKTHLACAIARNILSQGKYARYTTSEDMANSIATAWTRADDSEAAAVYRFTEYDLLIIDEYGLHDQHETRLKLVHKVLYARYDAKKPTLLISNMTVQELKNNLGDRLWSRFQHDGLNLIECNWADQRTAKGAV